MKQTVPSIDTNGIPPTAYVRTREEERRVDRSATTSVLIDDDECVMRWERTRDGTCDCLRGKGVDCLRGKGVD